MKDAYRVWINHNYPEQTGYGKCKEAVERMQTLFPELRIAKGFFHCIWGERCHWWLVAPNGGVVDPTRGQFPGPGEYEELQDHELADRVPTGVCMDCGDPVYHNDTFCSEECEAATRAYLAAPH